MQSPSELFRKAIPAQYKGVLFRPVPNGNDGPLDPTPDEGRRREATPQSGSGSAATAAGAALPSYPSAFSNAYWLAGDSVLKSKYAGRALPASATAYSRFFADIMTGPASGILWRVAETRKGYRRFGLYTKQPEGWIDDLTAASVSFAIYMLTEETQSHLLVSGSVGEHYRRLVGQTHSDLAMFIQPVDDADHVQMCARLSRVIGEIANQRRVKLQIRDANLMVLVMSAYTSTRGALDSPEMPLRITLSQGLREIASLPRIE